MTAMRNRPDQLGVDSPTTGPADGTSVNSTSVDSTGVDSTGVDSTGVDSRSPAGGRIKVRRSRMGGVWVALIVAAFVLLLLLIFILQNGQEAKVSFLGAHGTLPMGVALLLAAVFGVLLVALPGTARIMQLRASDRRATRSTVLRDTLD